MRKKSLAGSGKLLRWYRKEIQTIKHLQELGGKCDEWAEKTELYQRIIALIYDYLFRA